MPLESTVLIIGSSATFITALFLYSQSIENNTILKNSHSKTPEIISEDTIGINLFTFIVAFAVMAVVIIKAILHGDFHQWLEVILFENFDDLHRHARARADQNNQEALDDLNRQHHQTMYFPGNDCETARANLAGIIQSAKIGDVTISMAALTLTGCAQKGTNVLLLEGVIPSNCIPDIVEGIRQEKEISLQCIPTNHTQVVPLTSGMQGNRRDDIWYVDVENSSITSDPLVFSCTFSIKPTGAKYTCVIFQQHVSGTELKTSDSMPNQNNFYSVICELEVFTTGSEVHESFRKSHDQTRFSHENDSGTCITNPKEISSPLRVNVNIRCQSLVTDAGKAFIIFAPIDQTRKGLCLVCWEAPANTIFLPCRHQVCCKSCLSAQTNILCTVCRRPVQQRVLLETCQSV
eukprot:gene2411-5353_t